ncbi:retrotransposon-related protein [Tanacetum coccineum]
MVGTRNSSMETHVDDSINNWVIDHVIQVTNKFNQKFNTINTSLNDILSQMHFLVTNVNRLRGGEGNSIFSRLGKLEFPKFHGDDVQGWMFRMKQFFAIDNVHEDKVKINLYKEGIMKRFGSVNEDPMAELQNLSAFIAGLPASMEMNVRMFRPKTLADAFSLANFHEASLAIIRQKTAPLLPTPKISLNALSGIPTFNTMRMKASVAKHILHLLLDTGSTNNFLDLFTAKKLGCKMKRTCPLQVRVAGVNKLISQYMVYGFEWTIQGQQFIADENVFKGYKQSELQWMSGKQLSRQINNRGDPYFSSINCLWPSASLNLMQTVPEPNTSYDPELRKLLQEFGDVFAIPIELPLQRSCDHRIPLKDASTVINIRPYRYPPNHKDVIEQMVNELLDIGVELIDELHGAQVFSKLDLRFGYHQIRMCEEDIYKTAFKSHEAFRTRTLAPKHQSLSAYEKELLVVVLALQKWRGYLFDRHFKIKTNHFSLKYVLDQRITTPFQSKWLPKLLGFDYEIEYKKGKENVVVDAFSRVQRQSEVFTLLFKVTTNEFMDAVTQLWTTDPFFSNVIQGLQDETASNSKYIWNNQQLKRKGKWAVRANSELIVALVKHFHTSVIGLLQPLPIPTQIWHDISIYFVDALPMSQGKSTILVLVDRLSKYAHFIPVTHPYTAKTIAQLFLDHIYKLHGLLKSIVSDRDKKAQDRMKSQANKHRTEREFAVNDWIYLKVQPYRQVTIEKGKQYKISSKFYGPFQVIAKFKKCLSPTSTMGTFPECDAQGLIVVEPVKLLDIRLVKQQNIMGVFGLIQ